MKIKQALILTAGLGTRLRPFTEKVSKPLLPLHQVPLVQFVFDQAIAGGVEKAVCNLHHLATQTKEQIQNLEGPKEIWFSNESQQLLGSGGGVYKALQYLNEEPFFCLNADTLTKVKLEDVSAVHQKLKNEHGVEMTLVVLKTAPLKNKYTELILDPHKPLLRGLGEKKHKAPLFTGVSVLEPKVLKNELSKINWDQNTPLDFVETILKPSLLRGKVGIYLIDNSVERENESWFDIGTPESWFETHLRFLELIKDEGLFSLWKERILKQNPKLNSPKEVETLLQIRQFPYGSAVFLNQEKGIGFDELKYICPEQEGFLTPVHSPPSDSPRKLK